MTITAMIKVAGNYGYALTLRVMPEAGKQWLQDDEPVVDSNDRLIPRGHEPH